MKNRLAKSTTLLISLLLAIAACGGGGSGSSDGGSDSDSLRTNTCGDIGLSTRAAKIINGTACSNLARSAVVRLFSLNSAGEPVSLCTGTMITSTSVLTAAHCFPSVPSGIAIVAGDPESTTIINATSYSIHPNYRPTDAALFNDVAIVRAADPVPVPTLPLFINGALQGGDKVLIYGYGTDNSNNDFGSSLRSGEMRVTTVSADLIRADFDGNGSNTCFGDSGGPLIVNTASGPAIGGITSSGSQQSCGSGDMSLFTNIQSSQVLSFIRQQAPSVGQR